MVKRFEDFTKNVAYAGKSISKIKAYAMEQFGLRSGNVMCLYFIGQHPEGVTAVALAEKCGEDKAGISRSLATLRERGYIFAECAEGKYRAKFKVTEAGARVWSEVNSIILRAVDIIGANLTDEERSVFYKSFASITENLRHFCDEFVKE